MKRVQLNGADIEYDVRGSGAPVVFIHGAILSDGFVPVIEQTGIAENFRIVNYRRRGYAGSSRAPAGMTMQGWAGDCINRCSVPIPDLAAHFAHRVEDECHGRCLRSRAYRRARDGVSSGQMRLLAWNRSSTGR